MKYRTLLLLICGSILWSCSPTKTPPSSAMIKSDNIKLSQHLNFLINKFAFTLLPLQHTDFLFSPTSLFYPLTILTEGAKQQTREELEQLLFTGSSSTIYLTAIKDNLTSYQHETSLRITNSLWIAPQFNLLPNFTKLSKKYFFTPIFTVNFAQEKSRNQINSYVEQHTDHHILHLLPSGSIDGLTKLILINTISFSGSWEQAFNPQHTHQANFYGPQKIKIPFMQKELHANIYQDDKVIYLSLPYQGDRFSYTIIMPKKEKIYSFISHFSLQYFSQLQSMAQSKKIFLSLPKFKRDLNFPLRQYLENLGVKSIFSQASANLHGITQKAELFVTDIFHKSFITVDEKGTKAAAATAVVMGIKSMHHLPPRITINHPFIYMIYDHKMDLIMFIGAQSFRESQDE